VEVAGIDDGVQRAQPMWNLADSKIGGLPGRAVEMDGLAVFELEVGNSRRTMQGEVEDTVADLVMPRLGASASPTREKRVKFVGRVCPVEFHCGRG